MTSARLIFSPGDVPPTDAAVALLPLDGVLDSFPFAGWTAVGYLPSARSMRDASVIEVAAIVPFTGAPALSRAVYANVVIGLCRCAEDLFERRNAGLDLFHAVHPQGLHAGVLRHLADLVEVRALADAVDHRVVG